MASFLEFFRNVPKNNKIVLLGNTLEFFDLFLYIHFATVIAQKFFPPGFDKTFFFQAFNWSQVYFIAPVACLIFSYLGDKHGRRPIIIHTGLTIAIASTLVVFLPTYEAGGEYATILLLVLRIIQGIAFAGEPNAANLFLIENSSIDRSSLWYTQSPWYVRFATATEEFGGICALIAILLTVKYLGEYEHGWRLPFILCVFSICGVLWARFKLTESPEYIEASSNKLGVSMFDDGDNGLFFLKKVLFFYKRNFVCLLLMMLTYPVVFNFCIIQVSSAVVGNGGMEALLIHNAIVSAESIFFGLLTAYMALKFKWNLRKSVYSYVTIGLCAAYMCVWGIENGLSYWSITLFQGIMYGFTNFVLLRPALLKAMPVIGRYTLMGSAWSFARLINFFMVVFIIHWIKIKFGMYGCFFFLLGIVSISLFGAWYHVCYYTLHSQYNIKKYKREVKERLKS